MGSLFRRYWLQIGAVVVALGLTAGFYAWTKRGNEPAAVMTSSTATATPRSSATPTADPQEAAVVAAAKHYVEALARAYRSGSASELDTLVVAGSPAAGDVGNVPLVVMQSGKTFVVEGTTYGLIAPTIETPAAQAKLTYTWRGYDADWPALQRKGPDRTIDKQLLNLSFELEQGKWLIDAIR